MVVRIGGNIMWKIFFKNVVVVAILFGIIQVTKLIYPLDMWSVLFGVLLMSISEGIYTIWR